WKPSVERAGDSLLIASRNSLAGSPSALPAFTSTGKVHRPGENWVVAKTIRHSPALPLPLGIARGSDSGAELVVSRSGCPLTWYLRGEIATRPRFPVENKMSSSSHSVAAGIS